MVVVVKNNLAILEPDLHRILWVWIVPFLVSGQNFWSEMALSGWNAVMSLSTAVLLSCG